MITGVVSEAYNHDDGVGVLQGQSLDKNVW